MNWMKVVIAGVVAVNLYNWLMHGFIMGSTYMKYDTVFA